MSFKYSKDLKRIYIFVWDFLQTDTASVLFEATAHIRFLEGQIEVTFFLYFFSKFYRHHTRDERAFKSCCFLNIPQLQINMQALSSPYMNLANNVSGGTRHQHSAVSCPYIHFLFNTHFPMQDLTPQPTLINQILTN